MCNITRRVTFGLAIIATIGLSSVAYGQRQGDPEFGPVMTAYLGYLNNEQEVVDDRASRREITAVYYRRNSNRIQALRQMAIRLVRQNGNDYVPELEAVTADEFGTLFERPPHPLTLKPGEVFANKFRFLAAVHTGEYFYVFARLDPYEQAELMQKSAKVSTSTDSNPSEMRTRTRRVGP